MMLYVLRKFGFVVVVLFVGGPAARAETAAEVVGRVRDALGIDAFVKEGGALAVTGRTELLDLEGDYSFVFDAQGRFSRKYDIAVPNEAVFDGTTVRSRDIGGEVSDLSLGDRANAIYNAWAITGLWFAQERAGQFELDEKASNDDVVVLRSEIDDGRTIARAFIDREMWRPTKWEFQSASETTSVEVDGYEKAGPLMLPKKVTILSPNGGRNVLDMSASRIVAAPDWSKEMASLKQSNEATFAQGAKPELETKRANTGHLLVHPLVDGKDLGWFIFDTGAGQNVIDNRAMKEAGLKDFAAIPAVGVGGATQASLSRCKELTLGPATMRDVLLVGMDLAFLDAHMGEKIAGVIGYGMLARCVVEFDMPEGSIRLFDPQTYMIDGASWTPLMLYGRHPCIPGKFEGHDGTFRLDTGASGTVTFHTPTVERLKLLDKRKNRATTIGGVGGFKAARTGKVKWIEFGGKRHKKVKADFATHSTGAFADPYIDANIGGELIGESILILDYPHGRIAFKERAEEEVDDD